MNAIDIEITKVDRLGMLLAQIADLTKEAEAIKAEIKDAATAGGPTAFEGNLFKATVVCANRKTVDYSALVAELGCTDEQLAAFTKTTAVFSVKTCAR